MIPVLLAPLAVTLGKSILAQLAYTVYMPEGFRKSYPFLVPVLANRVVKRIFDAEIGLIQKCDHVVLYCHFLFGVQTLLAGSQFLTGGGASP